MQVYAGSESLPVDEHPSSGVTIAGSHGLRTVRPDGSELWLVSGTLDAGTSLSWSADHADEAVYVRDGSVSVDGQTVGPDAALVIESGAELVVTAETDVALVHVGGGAPESPSAGRVVIVGPGGTWSDVSDNRNTRFFADATSPSCSLWFLYSERFQRHDSPTHSHSQQEVIHVLRGELIMGAKRVRPGDTLYVEADRRYRFHSSDEGYAFLNYRAGPSLMTIGRDDPPIVENGAATGMTEIGDVVLR